MADAHAPSPLEVPAVGSPHALWLVRLGKIFEPSSNALFSDLGATKVTPLGDDLFLLAFSEPVDLPARPVASFLRWHFPVHHQWPTAPSKTAGFVEKAAQGLWKRFGAQSPKNVLVTSLHADPKSRALASNVRGRALQVFGLSGVGPTAEDLPPDAPIVLTIVGSFGLLAGFATSRLAKSAHPSGARHVAQTSPEVVSRAGAKVVEALDLLHVCGRTVPVPSHWLELGASPGGMTRELLDRGHRVTAVDRAPLSARLLSQPSLRFFQEDVHTFQPDANARFDALLCDMNGPWQASAQHALRLSARLHVGSPLIFTLKFNDLSLPEGVLGAIAELRDHFERAGCTPLLVTHTTSNRNEVTLLAAKR